MKSQNRKTRKEKNYERDVRKAVLLYDDYFSGITETEAEEIVDYLKFYSYYIHHVTTDQKKDPIALYIICNDTWQKWVDSLPQDIELKEIKDAGRDFLSVFRTEAFRKGFNSLLTYVRFLKLTLLEEDGMYRIVSENEQRSIKQWMQMKENFMKKKGIYVEMATPESTHVFEIPES